MLAFGASTILSAQSFGPPAEFVPPAPTERDEIWATIFNVPNGFCEIEPSTVVAGSVIRTTIPVDICIIGPPPIFVTVAAPLGRLPANTYTYEVYLDFGDGPVLRSRQTLIVAAALDPIPT